jgi:2-amino-4-hydroxy-6-hydroxymethyldihydropteridine diphosphokinase
VPIREIRGSLNAMPRCLLAVGANLGNRSATLDQALAKISKLSQTQLIARSRWHETAPVGGPAGQATFLNGAVLIDCQLSPQELLSHLQEIETSLGRERHERWDARTIDIDILLFGDETVETTELQIPHPRMSFRQFVLRPAVEIAGEMIHPASGWTLASLLRQLNSRPRRLVLVCDETELRTWLESEINRHLATDPARFGAIELVSGDSPGGEQATLTIGVNTIRVGPTRVAGPALQLTTIDRSLILQETLAAIDAAWPD